MCVTSNRLLCCNSPSYWWWWTCVYASPEIVAAMLNIASQNNPRKSRNHNEPLQLYWEHRIHKNIRQTFTFQPLSPCTVSQRHTFEFCTDPQVMPVWNVPLCFCLPGIAVYSEIHSVEVWHLIKFSNGLFQTFLSLKESSMFVCNGIFVCVLGLTKNFQSIVTVFESVMTLVIF